jgi:hypothetical protein
MDRLEEDWRERYGHGLLFAKTFVDLVAYAGTCYKAANWMDLGKTKGFERTGVDYYEAITSPSAFSFAPCDLMPVISFEPKRFRIHGKAGNVRFIQAVRCPCHNADPSGAGKRGEAATMPRGQVPSGICSTAWIIRPWTP